MLDHKMQSYYVYILKCSDNSYYTGHTDDLARRLDEHRIPVKKENGASSYVSTRLPFELVFVDEFGDRFDAQFAEHMIKGWSRKKKEALIEGGIESVQKVTEKGKFTHYLINTSIRQKRLDEK